MGELFTWKVRKTSGFAQMAGEGRRSGNLKLYVDLLSQPARAVTIFCR